MTTPSFIEKTKLTLRMAHSSTTVMTASTTCATTPNSVNPPILRSLTSPLPKTIPTQSLGHMGVLKTLKEIASLSTQSSLTSSNFDKTMKKDLTPTSSNSEKKKEVVLSPTSCDTPKKRVQKHRNALIPGMIQVMHTHAKLNITPESFKPYPGSPACNALHAVSTKDKGKQFLTRKRMNIGRKKIGRKRFTRSRNASGRHRAVSRPEGRVINAEHEQYALTYGMMMGILNSVGSNNQFNTRLTMNDFMKVEKKLFLYRPDDNTNNQLKHTFKFKDYSPDIFRQIRRRFNIDSADYMLTLCGDFNYIEFISNSKSGQFFFYSHDGRFMIKTQTKSESKFLRRILPHYYKYVMENPNTLITRFYGMHRVKMQHLRRQMHFVIMASVFNTPKTIHMKFDLKGSTLGREANKEEREKNGVLKDMDLIKDQVRLHVSSSNRRQLLDQIRKDVTFLKEMKIMDYSMLIGIHDASKTPMENPEPDCTEVIRTDRIVSDTQCKKLKNELNVSPLHTLSRSISLPDLHSTGYIDEIYESQFSDGDMDSRDYEDSDEELPQVPDASPLSPRLLDTDMRPIPTESIFSRDHGGMYGSTKDITTKREVIYFLGIIDILQQYNSKKIAETFFKSFIHDRNEISAVNPDLYAQRFIQFLDEKVLAPPSISSATAGSEKKKSW